MTMLEQLEDLMLDRKQYTLDQLSVILRADPQSLSARIRDLRKTGYLVERAHLGGRQYGYRIVGRR